MKISILDANSLGDDLDLSIYNKFGDVVVYGYTNEAQLIDRIKDTDIIITNKIILNAENMCDAKQLKLICITGTGTNTVDIHYANNHGIRVTNIVGYSTSSVAQHTFALLFYLMEKLSFYNNYVKSEAYIGDEVFSHFNEKFHDLSGKTFGIIGMGQIGQKVAEIAKVFGCEVIYYSTSGKNHQPQYNQVDFETLLKKADIVSIHAPLNDDTFHMIDLHALKLMKPTSYLLNLGRGDIIVEEDLAYALKNQLIKGAGLDVLSKEPMVSNSPLRNIKDNMRLLITPHIGWASVESRNRAIYEVATNIEAFIGGEKRNCVGDF